MRKLILAAAAVATLAAPAAAMANTGGSSNGQTGKLTGKNATAYTDYMFGNVKCNETQHPQFDTVSCTMTNTALAGTSGTVGWNSDLGPRAGTGTLTYTVAPDGLSYTGIATY